MLTRHQFKAEVHVRRLVDVTGRETATPTTDGLKHNGSKCQGCLLFFTNLLIYLIYLKKTAQMLQKLGDHQSSMLPTQQNQKFHGIRVPKVLQVFLPEYTEVK